MVRLTLTESYRILGLSQGTSLDDVKSTYKRLALKTHPDKNPGNAEATAQFQRLSEAYNVLLKSLDTSIEEPTPSTFHGFHPAREYYRYAPHDFYGDEDEDEDEDEDDFDDDEYSDEDYMDMEDFYRFLFEEAQFGRGSRFSQRSFYGRTRCSCGQVHDDEPPRETEQQYKERLRRAREEQEAAEERRKREDAHRKAEQENERARERQEAAKRKKAKASNKKVQAENTRKAAEDKVRMQRERSQTLRSTVFAQARAGNIEAAKKGIWEDSVDASGGEIKKDCEEFVKSPPQDKLETLAHIAATKGDLEFLQWLDTHGADLEERDSDGCTAFHAAAKHGHVEIMAYILETYPPEDANGIYESRQSRSLLDNALESRQPQAVWMILNKGLASQSDMASAWERLTSKAGRHSFFQGASVRGEDKLEEIINLLVTFGKFTKVEEEVLAPEQDTSSVDDFQSSRSSFVDEHSAQPSPIPPRGPRRQRPPKPHTHVRPDNAGPSSQPNSPSQERPHPQFLNGHGRGRGRGRGRGQFRGRGRGGSSSPAGPPGGIS